MECDFTSNAWVTDLAWAVIAAVALATTGCAAQDSTVREGADPQARRPPVVLDVAEAVVASVAAFDPQSLRVCATPTGDRIAFAQRRAAGWFVVLDGVGSGPYDQISPDLDYSQPQFALMPGFNRDCSRFAHLGRRGDQWHIVVDGVPSAGYRQIVAAGDKGYAGYAQFEPIGNRLAYTAMLDDGAWRVFVDGVDQGTYRPPAPATRTSPPQPGDEPVFTKGSESIGLAQGGERPIQIVQRDNQRYVVVDGVALKKYRSKGGGDRLLDAAGHVLGAASLFAQGSLYEPGMGDGPLPPVVQDAAGRVGYRVAIGRKWLYVVDEVEYGPYDRIDAAFSSHPYANVVLGPEGRHFAFLARRGDRYIVVVDGREGPAFERFRFRRPGVWIREPLLLPLRFSDHDRLHTYAIRGGRLVRIDITIRDAQADGPGVANIDSPDSRS